MPKAGEIVTVKDYPGKTFKILSLQGKFVMVQKFNVSGQTLGNLVLTVLIANIAPFKQDASEAAARIVKEATEQ